MPEQKEGITIPGCTGPVPAGFYRQDTLAVARQLLGCCLVHLEGENTTAGKIVETEAYLREDPAAHSFHGETKSNSVLFGPAGNAHVFFVYGMHWCMNVVTGTEPRRGAVLLRALEPVKGIPVMENRRKTKDMHHLCSGPGRLTQALAIAGECNGVSLADGPLRILAPANVLPEGEIVQTTRIGISRAQEAPYRFYLRDNKFVSRK